MERDTVSQSTVVQTAAGVPSITRGQCQKAVEGMISVNVTEMYSDNTFENTCFTHCLSFADYSFCVICICSLATSQLPLSEADLCLNSVVTDAYLKGTPLIILAGV